MNLEKNEPFKDPMLGKRVDIKSYTLKNGKPAEKPEVITEDSNENNEISELKESNNHETNTPPPPPQNDGKNYENDGILDHDEYVKEMLDQDNLVDEDDDTQNGDNGVIPEHLEMFAEIGIDAFQDYVPPVFVFLSGRISGVKRSDIHFLSFVVNKIPRKFYDQYEKEQKRLEKSLRLKQNEARLLKKSFAAFLQYKQVKAANPAVSFYSLVTKILFRMGRDAYQASLESRKDWSALFAYYGIEDPSDRFIEPPDEQNNQENEEVQRA